MGDGEAARARDAFLDDDDGDTPSRDVERYRQRPRNTDSPVVDTCLAIVDAAAAAAASGEPGGLRLLLRPRWSASCVDGGGYAAMAMSRYLSFVLAWAAISFVCVCVCCATG